MSYWTDADTVKKHVQAFTVDALAVRQLPVILEADTEIQLPHNLLVSGSVAVTAMLASSPGNPISLTLNGIAWQSLGYSPVLQHSVVISSTLSAETRYVEDLDYVVDEEQGNVRRIDGGSISSGASVYAWFLPLTTFSETSDYEINLTTGGLKALSTGDLSDVHHALVSYQTNALGASDILIDQVIAEAESKIIERLRDEYDTNSTDEGLIIGATELSLSLLCDDLALRSLTSVGDASADNRSHRFMELARRYESRAATTLSRYLKLALPATAATQSGSGGASNW